MGRQAKRVLEKSSMGMFAFVSNAFIKQQVRPLKYMKAELKHFVLYLAPYGFSPKGIYRKSNTPLFIEFCCRHSHI